MGDFSVYGGVQMVVLKYNICWRCQSSIDNRSRWNVKGDYSAYKDDLDGTGVFIAP